jgi:mxaJ protein
LNRAPLALAATMTLVALCIAAAPNAEGAGSQAAHPVPANLVICADPNNLPFSNQVRQGFENKIVELVARDLQRKPSYVWWAQRRGYVRNTLNESKCDIWPGIASGVDRVATTHPYYRSSYMFVSRKDAALAGLTLDDPRLKALAIGVQMVGNDANNTPPAHAIASRGIIDNVHGYMLYGNYAHADPEAGIVAAVAHRDVDVAMVWGPVAGFFAARSAVPLRLEAVTPVADSAWPMAFDIAMGVQSRNQALRDEVDVILEHERPAIHRILRAYHVPAVD